MPKEQDPTQRKVLGRGLSALLPTRKSLPAKSAELSGDDDSATSGVSLPDPIGVLKTLPLEQIQPNKVQPRAGFDLDRLQELARSIQANGLLQPITVQPAGPHQYRIIAGERRWRAAGLAGLTEIPALVRSVEQQQNLELALIENIQREDLNALDIAHAFHRLADQHGLSHEQIAERTGKDRSTITNFLRLLKLSNFVQNAVAHNRISAGHARALLNIGQGLEQAQLCQRIIKDQLSVRETERLVKQINSPALHSRTEVSGKTLPPAALDPNTRAALDEMAAALGTKVHLLAASPTRGTLHIEYYSQEDLDRIYAVITKS